MQDPRPLYGYIALTALCLLILGAGCSNPVETPATGSVTVISIPEGAGVYFNNEYKGTTPTTIRGEPVGSHTIEVRLPGYERWIRPVSFTRGETITVTADLVPVSISLPATFITTTTEPEVSQPAIHVDGFWILPEKRETGNPVPVLIHTDALNTGSMGAREVTVSANLYYEGRMVCWNTIYLGTLHAGDHDTKETMITCTLPSPLNEPDLALRFENLKIVL